MTMVSYSFHRNIFCDNGIDNLWLLLKYQKLSQRNHTLQSNKQSAKIHLKRPWRWQTRGWTFCFTCIQVRQSGESHFLKKHSVRILETLKGKWSFTFFIWFCIPWIWKVGIIFKQTSNLFISFWIKSEAY